MGKLYEQSCCIDEETELWEGCHLPKITQLVKAWILNQFCVFLPLAFASLPRAASMSMSIVLARTGDMYRCPSIWESLKVTLEMIISKGISRFWNFSFSILQCGLHGPNNIGRIMFKSKSGSSPWTNWNVIFN